MRRAVILALLIGPLQAASADTGGAWRVNAPVTSHLKNFVVAGMPKAVSLEAAIWAESVLEKIEAWAGAPVPGSYAYPLIIRAEERPDEPQGLVQARQRVTDDGHLQQELVIINRDRADQEDLLEGLCHLLLSRWAFVRAAGGPGLPDPVSLPQWLTCGAAQSLDPVMINRNLMLVREEDLAGRYQPALSVTGQLVMPPGRWPEKARAGLVIAWACERIDGAAILRRAADATAAGTPPGETFLLDLLGYTDSRALNRDWDLWFARQLGRISPALSAGDTTELSRLLDMRADDLGLAHPDFRGTARVPPERLIAERDRPWALDVAALMHWRLRRASIGKVPAIQEQVEPFLAFFAAIAWPVKEIRRGVNSRAAREVDALSGRDLERMWEKAAGGWRAMQESFTRRDDYLDRFDSRSGVSGLLDRWEEETR